MQIVFFHFKASAFKNSETKSVPVCGPALFPKLKLMATGMFNSSAVLIVKSMASSKRVVRGNVIPCASPNFTINI